MIGPMVGALRIENRMWRQENLAPKLKSGLERGEQAVHAPENPGFACRAAKWGGCQQQVHGVFHAGLFASTGGPADSQLTCNMLMPR